MTTWEILKEKGNDEFKKKNYNTAIELYTDAMSHDPNQDVLYSNRSLCYKGMENYRQALIDMQKALDINPVNVKNLKRKYDILVILGKLPDAEAVIQKCCNLEPKEFSHKQEFSKIKSTIEELNKFYEAWKDQKFDKVEELGAKLVSICQGNYEIKQFYMESLIANNKLQDATKFWTTKLTDKERSSDEFLFIICKIFYYEGNYEKAKSSLKRLLQRVNDNPIYNKLYHILNNIEKEKEAANNVFKEGKYKEAIEAYTKLIEIDPTNKIFNSTIYANRALCKF